ncbi:LLM class F420-dependent oxidoreductase [Asanoa ishikariensis]|uniref:Probable F420-dependent oxidoreductase, Rv1855c family n=1 Tax=Asanoa ishikariensis TaxID=137265 RepID=A0A1H3MZ84_9ACTN|nr:TIGR03560 family F420-dependent LLM class oxidoreductase [Asanoa ishikariensis]GIF68960.1 LLM class F420-dependent oxidoreductase [Asanoa ishikariensis]SDY81820.1 probable F420-dependent oxidoreductase, Rv1855c family [Asanoa ishikariensis]
MFLRIFASTKGGTSYADILGLARHAEACGFDGFFRPDHYLPLGGPPDHTPTDVWTTVAGLARDTTRIRLGSLMSAATFRSPGALAVVVSQVDEMSAGRVELGLGTGWYEAEHAAFGIPLPPVGERFERLAEQLAIVTGLWTAPDRFDHAGKHYTLTGAPALHTTQRPHPPVIVGGKGPRRTPRLAARYADEYNVQFASPADTKELFNRLDAESAKQGRTVRRSVCVSVACGRDAATVERRAAILRPPVRAAASGAYGSVDEVVDYLGQFAALGAERAYLRIADLADLDHLDLIAGEVMPQVAG